jgi:hypothetical protein
MMALAKALQWIRENGQKENVHIHPDSLSALTYVTERYFKPSDSIVKNTSASAYVQATQVANITLLWSCRCASDIDVGFPYSRRSRIGLSDIDVGFSYSKRSRIGLSDIDLCRLCKAEPETPVHLWACSLYPPFSFEAFIPDLGGVEVRNCMHDLNVLQVHC